MKVPMSYARNHGPRSHTIGSLTLGTLAAVTLFLVSPFLVAAAAAAPMPSSGLSAVTRAATYPADPPAPICGNSAFLSGPTSAPGGAVTVPQGDNSAINWNLPGATFWFAAGSHSLGGSMFSQIMPAANTTFLGAPNAVLDGNGVNRYAFTQSGTNVTIRYLNIQGFVPPHDEGVVNHDSAANWVIQDNWIHDNTGAAVMVGPGNVVAYNCIANNGQYGFNAFYAPGDNNITIDHNEISGNDTSNLDLTDPNCGCFGGGKIWNTMNGSVTNNWVHDNGGPGIWADTNNAGILIDGNYIADNDGEAIFYEISYNAQITNNNILRNNIVKGKSFAAQGSTFPAGAIYISNAGGDSRVDGGLYSTFTIAGNNLVDNWGGVTLWEDANRFCGSGGDSGGFCTLVNPLATLQTCVAGTINLTPYVSDCRWKTQNVSVHDNQFNYSAANVGCTTTGCGEQAIIANAGSAPSWTPYPGNVIDTAVTTQQNNLFSNNTYVGDWQFAWAGVSPNTFTQWQGGPSYQDPGSTFNGATFPPSVPGNLLDADTASLEGSMGHWTPWFSAAIATSTAQAHNGTHSLAVSVTAPNGWGIQLDVWPGFTAAPGPQTMSFWGILGSGNVGATMQVKWLDSTGAVLATKSLGITTLTTTWSRAVTTLTAPAGTAYA
ncbi:MAG: hypothetical protein QOK39_667, partial [Acidimicrobiaceae bacterium]|nr:hypothetical protein [Acidimicrobiaceae bacterium]